MRSMHSWMPPDPRGKGGNVTQEHDGVQHGVGAQVHVGDPEAVIAKSFRTPGEFAHKRHIHLA